MYQCIYFGQDTFITLLILIYLHMTSSIRGILKNSEACVILFQLVTLKQFLSCATTSFLKFMQNASLLNSLLYLHAWPAKADVLLKVNSLCDKDTKHEIQSQRFIFKGLYFRSEFPEAQKEQPAASSPSGGTGRFAEAFSNMSTQSFISENLYTYTHIPICTRTYPIDRKSFNTSNLIWNILAYANHCC